MIAILEGADMLRRLIEAMRGCDDDATGFGERLLEPVRNLVGTGVEGFRPVGYKTIDIEADHNPDIVADAAILPMIESGTAGEFYASHVL